MKKGVQWVKKDPEKKDVYWPSEEMKKIAWVSDESIYKKASENPTEFWAGLAKEGITWYKEWDETFKWTPPFYEWFLNGKLNISYNALDRHLDSSIRNKAAIIWEPEPVREEWESDTFNETHKVLTYYDLYREVNKFANVLKTLGVKKGDRVGIYLPMIPEVQIAMLACARIGAVHSVVFSAFSSESLKGRLLDAEPKVLITADGYYRRGKPLDLKSKADEGSKGTPVEKRVVVKRTGAKVPFTEGIDYWWHDLVDKADNYCKPEEMRSEDMLFILYTSGTTGKPKGVVHHTGGYAVQAYWTSKWDFDLQDDDVFWCTADVGWITGHTYSCYGPLMNGATMLMYEGTPDYPQPDRFWRIVEKYAVTKFYTAPTAIRMFMQWGKKWLENHDLSSLRILGTVGEPIDYDSWMWYFENVGKGRCPIIDTWWQTETGATVINSLPGIGPFIPTVAGRPFPGATPKILDEKGNPAERGYVVLASPFVPSLLRTVYKDPERYKTQYFEKFGDKYYFAGDGARLYDELGDIRVTGRIDDVLKVAGHRLSTAEIEDALDRHDAVTESAVIGAAHEIKGEVPIAFVIVKGVQPSEDFEKELIRHVDTVIGPIARPAKIYFVKQLPKTRSGKIMRRVLKRLVSHEEVGDISTLQNPEAVEVLKEIVDAK
jgi:acetyl-CoA synthetase